MSYGLVCLLCRKYLREEPSFDYCGCEHPVPSWDARTVAKDKFLPVWLKKYQLSEERAK